MVGRRRADRPGRSSGASAAAAFRPSPNAAPAGGPSRAQTAVLLAGVLVVAVVVAVASFAVKPATARSFQLLYGSVFIDDNSTPVAVDVASGRATVRLSNAASAVSASSIQNLDMVPLQGGTLMLDTSSGEFNMLDSSGLLIKPTGGGVRLPQLRGSADATTVAVPSGDSAYLVRSSATGTAVYLVGQLTVASAVGVTSGIKARAQATLRAPTAANADEMTSANGQFWLLAGAAGGTRRVEQLVVPRGSNAGATLAVHGHGSVNGVAALETATATSGGAGTDAVAVADATSVRVFPPGSAAGTSVRLPPLGQVDAIRPVRDAQGGFAFFYRSSDRWTLVRVPADGGPASTATIDGLDAADPLVTPVQSSGRFYTLTDIAPAHLMQVDTKGTASPVTGVPDYPVLPHERLNLDGAEVLAVGARVIFNLRGNFESVVVFSDGSQPPRTILKHSAVQVDASGSASINGDQNKKPTPQKQNKPQPRSQPAINNRINCKIASQTPHIPQVQIVQRASRSVQLHWDYPLLDPQDCDPSTYTVAVQAVTSGAPRAPSTVTVQGQQDVNVSGLFPDTTYEFVVTAYINRQHTSAPAIRATTSVEGPAAPTAVRTSVDASGNWTISWNSCGGVSGGCVPTADWQIIPHLCDGVGLSATPDTRRRVGDPTQHAFSYTYQGSEALLGRGMSFDIQGIGEKGTIGDSAGDHSCQYSWAPAVPADISVHPSAPPKTTGETTTHTDVSVQFTGGAQHDLGGVGGQLTYQLISNGQVVTKLGPTTKAQVTIPGINAGQKYQVAVVVNPPRHPERSARIGPVDVVPAIAVWPVPLVSASFDDGGPYNGTLAVTVSMPAGTDVHGETFDLTDDSVLRCGNTTFKLNQNDLKPGQRLEFGPIDRTELNSRGTSCRVSVQLTQNKDSATSPPLYGDGTTSRSVESGAVSIDAPSLTAGANDFDAKWVDNSPDHPQIAVSYSGNDSNFLIFAKSWRIHLTNGASSCGTADNGLSQNQSAVVIDVAKDCIEAGGGLSASVGFDWYGQSPTYSVDVQGSGPTPLQPGKMSFTADWDKGLLGLGKPVVQIQKFDAGGASQSDLDAVDWTWKVTSNGVNCGTVHTAPSASGGGLEGGDEIHVTFDVCPRSQPDGTPSQYTLTATYKDPNYGTTPDFPPVNLDPLN